MWYIIFLIIYLFTAIILVLGLLINGMRPTKTLAWLLAIFTIPVGGALLYLIFGRNRRKNKFFKLKKTRTIDAYLKEVDEYCHSFDNGRLLPTEIQDHVKLVRLIARSSNFLPSHGNQLQSLKTGEDTYKAIFEAMEKAKKYIHVQYYIFEEGELAHKFLEILKRKSEEGLIIRFLYDGFGSWELGRDYLNSLEESGIATLSFMPIRFGRLLNSVNYRNHRKIVIVDGKIGFTGGFNVSDKYITGDLELGIWHDIHMRLEGPIVTSLQAVFAIDWLFASGKDDILSTEYFTEQPAVGNSIAQMVASGPDSDFSSIHHLYFALINNAKEYVYITNPYIIPGNALLEALQVAAMGGVDVRLLLSSKSDSILVKWSVRSYFEVLLSAGVKIYLYPKGFLHGKMIISDDQLATIGSANMDIRSFEQNYEVNVLAYDAKLTQELKRDFLRDCEKSDRIDYREFLERPRMDRLKEGFAKIFSPIL